MYEIKENIKNIDEFNYLYDSVGWDIMKKNYQKKHWIIQCIQYQYMTTIK